MHVVEISRPAMNTLNDIICGVFKRVLHDASWLLEHSKKKTMTVRVIHYASKLNFQNWRKKDELWVRMRAEAIDSMRRFYLDNEDIVGSLQAQLDVKEEPPTAEQLDQLRREIPTYCNQMKQARAQRFLRRHSGS